MDINCDKDCIILSILDHMATPRVLQSLDCIHHPIMDINYDMACTLPSIMDQMPASLVPQSMDCSLHPIMDITCDNLDHMAAPRVLYSMDCILPSSAVPQNHIATSHHSLPVSHTREPHLFHPSQLIASFKPLISVPLPVPSLLDVLQRLT